MSKRREGVAHRDWRGLSDAAYCEWLSEMLTVDDLRCALGAAVRDFRWRVGLDVEVVSVTAGGQLSWAIELRVRDDCGVVCRKCGRRVLPDAPPVRPELFQCGQCHGNREATRRVLMERQCGRCIVWGCDYDEAVGGRMDIHRILPGRELGSYEPENCVLVCRHHHKGIEGLSRKELVGLR